MTVSEIVYRCGHVSGWQGWDPVLNEPVWEMTYDYPWDLIQVALPFVANRTPIATMEETSKPLRLQRELTERTDARGATYYRYDALGRRTCAADRDGRATWEYDPTNGKGLLKNRSYDRDTFLTSASSCAFGSDFAETYTYNADARLTRVRTSIVDDGNATTTLTRSHGYDGHGRLSSTTYPSSVTVKHEYNDRGYLAKLKHGATALVNVTAQSARGRSKSETYGNGVRTERSYDELGRLTDIDTALSAAAIQDNAYAWRSDRSLERRTADAAGGRGKRHEAFDYDYLNRLTGAETYISDSATASRTLAFDYDLRGNLKTKTSDVSADKSTSGYDYASGTKRIDRIDHTARWRVPRRFFRST